jgi:patatin-like phospholipase/acyl hydrolase
MAPFRILSLDGGGIRGLIPALVLTELEQRTGKPTAQLFDLIAGTSTGGILALGLTRPGPGGKPLYRADDMVGFYEQDGGKIFARSPLHRLKALGNLADEKYPSHGIDAVLKARFGETMLSEAVTPVLVTSYDIEEREPYFFKSHRAKLEPPRNHLMRDAARATSAAPTYFEPVKVPCSDRGKGYKALVDGGVYANNPGMCALVESLCFFDQTMDDVVMLSLGTGEYTRPIMYADAKGWGLAKWAQPVLNVVFDGVSDTVNYQVQSLLTKSTQAGRYLRIQTTLTDANDDMDDASPRNMKALKLTAEKLIAENDAALDAITAHLTGAIPARPRPSAPVRPPVAIGRGGGAAVQPPTA